MYVNYGDKNFFENGCLIEERGDGEFGILFCRPYCDEEDMFQFGHAVVDVSDGWIDRDAVESFSDVRREEDPALYAAACLDYYGPENFGAADYGVSYDWRHVCRATAEKELRHYQIDDGLEQKSMVNASVVPAERGRR